VRRTALLPSLALLLTGLASGCTSSASDTPAAATATADTVLFSDDVDGRGTVTQHADGSRTVTSSWGEVTVPADPERVVAVIGDIDLETMLALDARPIAAGTQGGTIEEGFAPHLAGMTDGIEPLAWADGAPAEQIAGLEPDLIFAPTENEFDVLGDVAPTVPRGAWDGDWKQDLRYVAAVLGRSDEAEELLEEFGQRAADIRDGLGERAGNTVASAQLYGDHAQIGLDGPASFSTAVLSEVGLEPIALSESGEEFGVDLSMERLPDIDADHVFWQVRQGDDGEPDHAGIEVLRANALWERVPAVAADQVHLVDNRPWYFPTILGAHVILDDVEAALLEDEASDD
jgi:iron complex transport system substrate-binding protein